MYTVDARLRVARILLRAELVGAAPNIAIADLVLYDDVNRPFLNAGEQGERTS